MAKLEVSRSLLVGLIGVAAASVLGMVFLLGRATAPRVPVAQKEVRDLVAPTTAVPSAPSLPGEQIGTPSIPSAGATTIAIPRPAPPPIVPVVTNADEALRPAVATYFRAIDSIQPQLTGDPESVAQEVMAGLGKGDTSGFDRMIQQAEATRARLSALAPPTPCAAYHRDSLACLEASLDLMHSMKQLLSAPGQGASGPDLTDQANAMKARTEALQRQEKTLRQRFGLAK